MYPRLSDLIQDIFGIYIPLPIQTYGFMMATAFVVGSWIAYIEMKRLERQGILLPFYVKEKIGEPPKWSELLINFAIWFLIGYKLIYAAQKYDDFVADPQGFLVSKDGNLWGGVIVGLVAAGLLWWQKKSKALPKPKVIAKKMWPHQLIGNLIVVGGVWGLIGAKIFHILAHIKDEFLVDPIGEIFSFGGLAFYGGFIVGFIAVLLYLRKYNINWIIAGDVAAVVLSISYAIGRIGCQVAGDGCWGIVNTNPKPKILSWLPDWAWAYNYPHNVINAGVPIPGDTSMYNHVLPQPVFPTPLYEMTIMFLVFLFLWSIRKKVKVPGTLFSLYLILAGIERFFVEFIRITNRYNIFGIHITQAQLISIFMIISGIVGLYLIYRYPEKVKSWAEIKPKEINYPPKDVDEVIETELK